MSATPRKIFDLLDVATEPSDAQLAELMRLAGDDIRAESARLSSVSSPVVAERSRSYGSTSSAAAVAEARPELVVIAGPDGSGKTTITRRIVQHAWGHDSLYLNPAEIAERDFGGWNSPDAMLQATRHAVQIRADCLASRTSLMLETSLSAPGDLAYLAQARAAGFFIRLLFICTDDSAINVRRVARRFAAGGQAVAADKMVSHYAQSIANCALAIGQVDHAYLYDNSIDNADPALLFRVGKGVLKNVYRDPISPWAQPIFDRVTA